MTAEADDPVAKARTLRDRAGLRRPGEDRAYVEALVALMRADGLLAACVPRGFGGAGLGLADLARIAFQVGRADGSAGLIYAMHMSQALSVVAHGRGPFFALFQERMARDGLLIASGTSEKGPGGDIFTSVATIEEAGGGEFLVTKESPNISYVDLADAILVSANRGGAGRARQVLVLAERSRTEFAPGRTAAFLGMRGMLNASWTFTARFGAEAIFPDPFPVIARRTMTPGIHVLWAATWSGIAAAALAVARTFLAQEVPPDSEAAPALHLELARLCDRHYVMNALIRDALRDAEAGGGALDLAQATRSNRLKICASELVGEIVRGALGIVGIRGYATAGPYTLAAPLADALSAPIMVSNLRLSLNNAKIVRFVEDEI